LLKGLIEGIVPEAADEAEAQARALRGGSEALRAFGSLQARGGGDAPVVRSALWVGLYYYGAGEVERALVYFEKARAAAHEPDLVARAEFWCEQARLRAGREPLAGKATDGAPPWNTLHGLNHVDRLLREGRRSEAETRLLGLEGEARRAGLLGLVLARWGDLLRAGGGTRVSQQVLVPMVRECSGLPEALRMAGIPVAPEPASGAEASAWAIQTGAFLDQDNARRQQEQVEALGLGLESRIEERAEEGETWYLVRAGRYASKEEADSAAAALLDSESIPHEIVPVP
jgi:hypothetical protein